MDYINSLKFNVNNLNTLMKNNDVYNELIHGQHLFDENESYIRFPINPQQNHFKIFKINKTNTVHNILESIYDFYNYESISLEELLCIENDSDDVISNLRKNYTYYIKFKNLLGFKINFKLINKSIIDGHIIYTIIFE
jgi:hypothetical protein